MAVLMPPETVYVTILRNPVAMFESMYSYYNLESFYKFKFDLFDSPNRRDLPDFSKRYADRIGTNQMFFDLGFDFNNSTIDPAPHLDYLNSVFDLVMIEERMDESLVLLRDLLRWSPDDVLTFRVNARIEKHEIGRLAIERIRALNRADVQLYDYFLAKFEQRLARLDKQRLERELRDLRSRRRHWFSECVDIPKTKQQLQQTGSAFRPNIVQFATKNDDLTCRFLTAKELELTRLVRTNQLRLFPDSVFTSAHSRAKSTPTRRQAADEERFSAVKQIEHSK